VVALLTPAYHESLVPEDYLPFSICLWREFVRVLTPRRDGASSVASAKKCRLEVRCHSGSIGSVVDVLRGHSMLMIHLRKAERADQSAIVEAYVVSLHAPSSEEILYRGNAIQQHLAVLASVICYDILRKHICQSIPVLVVNDNCVSCEYVPDSKCAIRTARDLLRHGQRQKRKQCERYATSGEHHGDWNWVGENDGVVPAFSVAVGQFPSNSFHVQDAT
jgi:hypothetical protein